MQNLSTDRSRNTTTHKAGFTLIELLVTLSIIGILIALLLPAVQASRESARRTQCLNNLKQLGLAIANYTELHGGMPPGYVSIYDPYFRKEVGPGWGWATMLLPFIEQQPIYDDIDFNLPIHHAANATVRVRPIELLLCPTDNMPRVWTTTEGVVWIYSGRIYSSLIPICDVAASNYVGVFGVGEPGVDGDGVFYRNSFTKPMEIVDGLSHTLSVGERSVHLNAGRGHATWVGAIAGAQLWSCAPDPFGDPDAGVCRKEDGSGMTLGHTGEGNGPGDLMGDVNQFFSRHGRGAHFLFCDGHVRYLSGTMHYPTYKAISTRDGQEYLTLF